MRKPYLDGIKYKNGNIDWGKKMAVRMLRRQQASALGGNME
jgi:hypothetical protein